MLVCNCPVLDDGTKAIPWISEYFQDCVYSSVDLTSFAFGLASILLYMVSMLPQVYKNYTRKSVDGLSVSFLLTWLAGDISNLIGSLFTNQLTTQKYTALFFVISDILLVLQYVYYKVWYFGTGTGVQFESLVEVCVGNDDKDENGSSVDSSATNVDDEVDYLTPSENSPLLSKSNGKPNSDSGTLLPNNQNSISSISSINKPDDLKSYSSLDNSSSSIEEVNLIRQYSRTSSNGGVFHRLERASEYIQSSSSSCTSGEIKINYEKPALDIIYEGTKKPMKTKHSNKLPSFFSKPAKSMILQTTIILQLISTVASSSDSDNPLCDDPLHQSSQWMLIMGSIMAWSSGLLYFFSRIPQILTNYKLKNVEGLSIFLFVITISANLMYGVSIILRLPKIDGMFFANRLPYLIGSIGTLFFDFTIVIQSYMYRK